MNGRPIVTHTTPNDAQLPQTPRFGEQAYVTPLCPTGYLILSDFCVNRHCPADRQCALWSDWNGSRGTRTLTPLRVMDFESIASANSAREPAKAAESIVGRPGTQN